MSAIAQVAPTSGRMPNANARASSGSRASAASGTGGHQRQARGHVVAAVGAALVQLAIVQRDPLAGGCDSGGSDGREGGGATFGRSLAIL